jgi:hypothetical protein
MTAQGHPWAIFRRAIERGNVVVAEATAREIGFSLREALQFVRLCLIQPAFGVCGGSYAMRCVSMIRSRRPSLATIASQRNSR